MKYLLLAALLLPFFVRAQVENDPALVAYYSFDDCNATETSGNSESDGQLIGDPGCVCGVSGNALEFDGQNDHVLFLGYVTNKFNTANFTVSFYFKPYGQGLPMDILSKRDDCSQNNAFSIVYTPNQRFLNVSISESVDKIASMTATVDYSNCWHHVVVVRNSGSIKLFLDGKLAKSASTISRVDLSNSTSLSIANSPCIVGPGINRFRGAFDELRVYERALTDEEAISLYLRPDFIANRDTLLFLGTSVNTFITGTCAEQFKWTANRPNSGIGDDTNPATLLTPSETTTYRLNFTYDDGCVAYDTLHVRVIDPSALGCDNVYLPKAFTPNDDALNENFGISNPYVIQELESFEIFDRWGGRVFSTDNPLDTWDGTFRGQTLDTGVFLYKIKYKCDGAEKSKVGSLVLMR
jgi:gliding motility-associated-like protein